jgi:hypothetical protein
MSKETRTDKMARQGGENEARAGLEYHRMMQKQTARKTDRKARKTKR